MSLVFVDVEAVGPCPSLGTMTEFGAVEYKTRQSYYGILADAEPDPVNPAKSIITGEVFDPYPVMAGFASWLKQFDGRSVMISDNPAYDFQWINDAFWKTLNHNPFGHSARRIGDYYAGLVNDFYKASAWKSLRITAHDHHPVHDAIGNVEAFERIQRGERSGSKRQR